MREKITLLLAFLLLVGAAPQKNEPSTASVRFAAVEIYVDSGAEPLAAYQVTFSAKVGEMQVVGVENGEHPAFAAAPYYDRKAIQRGKSERVIVAAYNTGPAGSLPRGRTRVTTIHLQISGNKEIEYELLLNAAATVGEKKITAAVSYAKGSGK